MDPGGPKTYGSYGSGSGTLLLTMTKSIHSGGFSDKRVVCLPSVTPRKMNGATVVLRAMPAARPQAATAPPAYGTRYRHFSYFFSSLTICFQWSGSGTLLACRNGIWYGMVPYLIFPDRHFEKRKKLFGGGSF
jgi:hypothetical protein